MVSSSVYFFFFFLYLAVALFDYACWNQSKAYLSKFLIFYCFYAVGSVLLKVWQNKMVVVVPVAFNTRSSSGRKKIA